MCPLYVFVCLTHSNEWWPTYVHGQVMPRSSTVVAVDQFTPVYLFTPTPKISPNQSQLHNKLPMYMINLIIIYVLVNIFSVKHYKSLRKLRVGIVPPPPDIFSMKNYKLRVGVNGYTGVNWSTTTGV